MKDLIKVEVDKILTTRTCSCDDKSSFGSKHKIIVCQKGFVYAGDVTIEGHYIVINNAVNIRRWGTTKGLGQLAEEGVLENTITDYTGIVRVHELSVVLMIDCKARIYANT